MIRIGPYVNGVQEIRVDCMNDSIKHEHRRPVNERRYWLKLLEFRALLVEWHRDVEQNVEKHCHRQEHRVHFQVALADLRLIAVTARECERKRDEKR